MLKKIALGAVAPVAVLGGMALAGAANAAPVQFATTSLDGPGAAASYSAGTWTLNSGHGTPGGAHVNLVRPGTSAVAPTFTADHEQAGNPRWVIEFHNGDSVVGFPPAGASANAITWTENGKAEPSYATALKAAQADSDASVTAAFIVMDTGNKDTTVNLTGVTYNGKAVVPQPKPPATAKPFVFAGHVVTVSNTRATVAWSDSKHGWPAVTNGVKGNHCVEVREFGFGFTVNGSPHVGFTCDNGNPAANLGFLTGLHPGHTYFLQVVPATGTYGNHHQIPGTDSRGGIDVFTTR